MEMMGALAETKTIPLSAELMREAISEKTKRAFVETNLKAFDFGMDAAAKDM